MLSVEESQAFKWSATVVISTIVIYIITLRYYADWWFILFFVIAGMALIYAIVLLYSIIFWIGKRKIYRQAYTPLLVNIINAIIWWSAPSVYSNKNQRISTEKLYNQHCNCCLYKETYLAFGGGATATDLDAIYLTDLKNFRLYVGSYSGGNEQIHIRCDGDHIITTKYKSDVMNMQWDTPEFVEQKTYRLNILRQYHVFQ